jgi:hypothetical protein
MYFQTSTRHIIQDIRPYYLTLIDTSWSSLASRSPLAKHDQYCHLLKPRYVPLFVPTQVNIQKQLMFFPDSNTSTSHKEIQNLTTYRHHPITLTEQ